MTEPDETPSPADRALAPPPQLSPDERARAAMAGQLATLMLRVDRMLDQCEGHGAKSGGDPIGALNAAARLVHAGSHIAGTLARVVQVESRHRSIVETIQKPDPKMLELEARKNKKTPAQMRKDVMAQMLPALEGMRKQEEDQRAEDYRAAAGTCDAPLHLPY